MKFREKIRSWHLAMAGYRVYLLAFILALPDILDGLAGFDFATILPVGWGAKMASYLAIGRIVFGIYVRQLAANRILKQPDSEENQDRKEIG